MIHKGKLILLCSYYFFAVHKLQVNSRFTTAETPQSDGDAHT